MRRPIRRSLVFVAMIGAAVALGAAWRSLAQPPDAAAGSAAEAKQATAAPQAKTKPVPVGSKTPAPKPPTDGEADHAANAPQPEAALPENIPPELKDPLVHPGPMPAEPSGPGGLPRKLAPWVMTVVVPEREIQETVIHRDMVERLTADPKFDWAKRLHVPARRRVWALEFRFKPMRIIQVDVPQPSGRMQRKPIWYLVYCVINRGKLVERVVQPDGKIETRYLDEPVHFAPAFLLHSITTDKWYPDRVIPVAMGPIRLREDPKRQLYDSVEIIRDVQPNETVWGVATWEDIDPRTDRFSVYVAGLTNAYPSGLSPQSGTAQDRRWLRKTLKIDFWRPGDDLDVEESQIRLGLPGQPPYQWVYRDWAFRPKTQPAVPPAQ